ncbi:hypothetical protein HS088_TW17G00008 [Tripterygium wilfordii]|uniref:Uncharacterized protein n=1 Tax=Tripterygium wilfordii TaxID=458696 RepID=A0A7J7CE98_TRIWF|nr:hypothetical protein HS088_TW17G00008 [Tripterygium wilfordii]
MLHKRRAEIEFPNPNTNRLTRQLLPSFLQQNINLPYSVQDFIMLKINSLKFLKRQRPKQKNVRLCLGCNQARKLLIGQSQNQVNPPSQFHKYNKQPKRPVSTISPNQVTR